jgi:chromate transporter
VLRTILREWGRIGALGFGGPPAHVALLRELCVDRRSWMSAREFEDANAACLMLPGPGSTQMAIYCARRVGGSTLAGLLGGVAFIVPGLLVVLAIAAVALGDEPPLWIRGLGAGAAAAVVVVVAHAGLMLGRSNVRRGRSVAYLLAGVAAAVLLGPLVVIVLLACGLAELAWTRREVAVVAFPVWLALAWMALKAGGLSFGGGFVIIPLMQGDALAHDWMSRPEFANAVAYGQITPGPVTHTVALVGWAGAGAGGALLATVIAFAPSFLMVLLGGGAFERLRGNAGARRFLDGAGPAGVGAILGAAVTLARGLQEPWQYAVAVLAAAALALGRPPLAALLGGGALGLLAAAAGATIP